MRWAGAAAIGFVAGTLSMVVVTQAMLWLFVRYGLDPQTSLPAAGAGPPVQHVVVPFDVAASLWGGLCGAVAALLVDWLFGRRAGLAAPMLFVAVLLIVQRLRGEALPFWSVELALGFAVAWAIVTWLFVMAGRAAVARLQGRKK
ncbi:hypothetical protein [Reyranella sp.]|uniref:hypothetical protein n=1 Tax=Reyranella sp. TaxID=1929291 RepID=UPI003BACC28F